MDHNNHIAQLLFRHLQGTLTDTEKQELEDWAQQSWSNRELLNSLDNEEELMQKLADFNPDNRLALRNRILDRVLSETRASQAMPARKRLMPLRKWGWAAAAAILCVAGYWLLNRPTHQPPSDQLVQKTDSLQDTPPGKNGATLTLNDGRVIVLDSAANGLIALQAETAIHLQNGKLKYEKGQSDSAGWNIITTTNGRQYSLQLSDGTRVWLNAASSLRYPVTFSGSKREVTIQGEAYFEIAANHRQPFFVHTTGGASIAVLGTAFNVNAYANEPAIRTTLIDGSIRVEKNGITRLLTPAQQAVINDRITVVRNVNTDQITAWKNGYFNLTDTPMEEFMRQLERWYDIEVKWEGEQPGIKFFGEIYRGEPLSKVLEFLQQSGVRFRKENNGKLLVLTK